jgi:hypothetical protein
LNKWERKENKKTRKGKKKKFQEIVSNMAEFGPRSEDFEPPSSIFDAVYRRGCPQILV